MSPVASSMREGQEWHCLLRLRITHTSEPWSIWSGISATIHHGPFRDICHGNCLGKVTCGTFSPAATGAQEQQKVPLFCLGWARGWAHLGA